MAAHLEQENLAGNISTNTSRSVLPGSDITGDNLVGYIGAAIIVVILSVGAAGNGTVLISILRFKKLQQQTDNILIASLAVTDLTFNILIMPFYVDTYINQRWRYSHQLCMAETFCGTLMVMSSAYHIALIAIIRYFHIVHPTTIYPKISTKKAICLQITFIWTICALIILPSTLGWQSEVGYSNQIGRCNYIRSESKGSLCLIFVLGFILPCVTMVSFYMLIVKKLERSSWKVNSYSEKRSGREQDGEVRLLLSPPGERRDLELKDMRQGGSQTGHSEEITKTAEPSDDCSEKGFCDFVPPESTRSNLPNAGEMFFEVNKYNEQRLDGISLNTCVHATDESVINTTAETTNHATKQQEKCERINCDELDNIAASCTNKSVLVAEKPIPLSNNAPTLVIKTPQANNNSSTTSASCQPTEDECSAIITSDEKRSSPLSHPHPPFIILHHSHHHHRHHMKSLRMILVIFVAFVSTYLPFAIINLVDGGSTLAREWYMISSLGFWAGACVNPIIYGLMNSQFLEAYRHVLCCKRRNRPGDCTDNMT